MRYSSACDGLKKSNTVSMRCGNGSVTYLDVVVVKKENYSHVVFEGDDMGLRKGFRAGHICMGSIESTEDVFGEPNLVQLWKDIQHLGMKRPSDQSLTLKYVLNKRFVM